MRAHLQTSLAMYIFYMVETWDVNVELFLCGMTIQPERNLKPHVGQLTIYEWDWLELHWPPPTTTVLTFCFTAIIINQQLTGELPTGGFQSFVGFKF